MTAATASRLIVQARADGLELVPNGDKLKLRGTAEVVERWKPRLAGLKAEVMEALTRPIPDYLAAMIETAAQFYQYSGDDLASINDLARRDPEGLRAALLADPLRRYMAGRTLGGMMDIDQSHPAPDDATAAPCAGRGGKA